jgi:hypothetical protein
MGAHGTLEEALANVSSFATADAQNELDLKGSKEGKSGKKSGVKKSSKKAHKADRKHEQSDKKKVQLLACNFRTCLCLTLSHQRPDGAAMQFGVQCSRTPRMRGGSSAEFHRHHCATYGRYVMQEKDSKKAKHGKRSKSSKRSKSRRESSPESGSGSGSDSDSRGGRPAGRKPQGGLQVELARARHAARCTRELLLQYPEQRRDLRQVLPLCFRPSTSAGSPADRCQPNLTDIFRS